MDYLRAIDVSLENPTSHEHRRSLFANHDVDPGLPGTLDKPQRNQNATLDFRILPQMYTASKSPDIYTVAEPFHLSPALKKLYIGGLFELSDTSYTKTGTSELAAATLALKHINEKQFIPGYYLDMVYNDTMVSATYAFDLLLLYDNRVLRAFKVTSCAEHKKPREVNIKIVFSLTWVYLCNTRTETLIIQGSPFLYRLCY